MTGSEKRTLKADQFAFLETALTNGWVSDFTIAIDGGANVGTWAIRMARQFERVIAFEPSPEIYRKLDEAASPFSWIECRQQALLDRACKVKIMRPPKGKSLRSLYVRASLKGGVDAVTIDSLALPSVGFIKLDLEGAEFPALRGAKRTIAKHRPVLFLEMDRKLPLRFGRTIDQTEALLSSMGYVEVGRSRPDRVYRPIERIS